jgi:hypothetical protein
MQDNRGPSRFSAWREQGGSVYRPHWLRFDHASLYPYLVTRQPRVVSYSNLGYALLLLACWGFMLWFALAFLNGTFSRRVVALAISPTPSATTSPAPAFEFDPGDEVALKATRPVVNLSELPVFAASSLAAPTLSASPTLTLTPTSSPSATPLPSATFTPSPTPICPNCQTLALSVRLGWFYPPLGGSHCPDPTQTCAEQRLSSGLEWLPNLGLVAACPLNLESAWVQVEGIGVFRCAHALPVIGCDWQTNVCDISILSHGPVAGAEDWRAVHQALIYFPP